MLVDGYNQRETTFLRINADGQLYISSKEPKEGYVEYKSKTGHISYRKTYQGIMGKLSRVIIKEIEYDDSKAKFVMMFIDDGNENFAIVMPLFTQKGGLNSYVKSFVRYYRNIDITKDLVIAPMARKKDEKYAPGGFWINYVNDEGKPGDLVKQYFKRDQNGWPDLEKETSITGEVKWSSAKQDKFAYERFMEYIKEMDEKRGKGDGHDNSAADSKPTAAPEPRKEAPAAKEQAAPSQPDFSEENDDLPF